jgi:hypothetical protein
MPELRANLSFAESVVYSDEGNYVGRKRKGADDRLNRGTVALHTEVVGEGSSAALGELWRCASQLREGSAGPHLRKRILLRDGIPSKK